MSAEQWSGAHRPARSAKLARRLRYGALAAAIGLVTVAVPPLIAPDRNTPQAAVPPLSGASATATPSGPSGTPDPAPTAAPPSAGATATPTRTGAPACVPERTGPTEVTSRPTCAVYTTALGNGWRTEAAGLKVIPVAKVPGTEVVAMRLEPQRQEDASVAIVAAYPVTVPAGARLRLRLYGGREHGTVLRITMSSTAKPGRGPEIRISSPVDVWTDVSLRLDEQTGVRDWTVQRIDVEVATDEVPHAWRFFLDDIRFVA